MVPGLVTTIIPVYNRPNLLREAIDSVLAQTHRPIEIIVVDDGSTDETGEVAEKYATEHPDIVRVLHVPNGGPGLAREAGRREARGEFLQYLDSDDLLLERKFEWQVKALRESPEAGVTYGITRYVLVDGAGEIEPWKGTGERRESMFPTFLRDRWWGTSTPLYRRDLIDQAGEWTSLRNEEDWEYDCRIAALGTRLCYVRRLVSIQRDHGGERLSRNGLEPAKLRDRARAHELILEHAERAGIPAEAPEMRHFARELFLLARQCGAVGLASESRTLLALSQRASGDSPPADLRAYSALAGIVGWNRLGRWTCGFDRLRRNPT